MHSVLCYGLFQSSFSGILDIPWNFRNSAEHTSELNHSRARLICSGIPDPEFQREGTVTSAAIPYHTTIFLQFAHTIQCCLWCLVCHHRCLHVLRPQHPQPVDAETECQGRIRNIEFKVLMYTQLAVLNNQRLRDLDKVVLKKWSTHSQMLIGRMHGLYLGGKNHSLLRESRDQRWFHHAKSCVHYMARSDNAY